MRTPLLPAASILAVCLGCAGPPAGAAPPLALAAEAPAAPVELATSRGSVRGILHPAPGAAAAVLMVAGARGGTEGPSGLYPRLAASLQARGIASFRLDFRRPADLDESVRDARAALAALRRAGARRVVVVGWSFGGAVAITAAARSDLVVGVATLAGQSAGTGDAAALAPRSLLLFHGTADPVLPDWNSRDVYSRAGEPRELVLLPGEGHQFAGARDELAREILAWAVPLLRDPPLRDPPRSAPGAVPPP